MNARLRGLVGGIGLATALWLVPAPASASTIPADCRTCGSHDAAFDLSYPGNASPNPYQFVVTATYGTPIDFAYLDSIAFKIDSARGIDAGGCSDKDSGFWCLSSGSTGSNGPFGKPGETDTWTFGLALNAPLPTSNTGPFKAQFIDPQGNKLDCVIYEHVPIKGCPTCGGGGSVPEPMSLVLLGTGLAGLAIRRRQRRLT